jgi:hypothetical protein
MVQVEVASSQMSPSGQRSAPSNMSDAAGASQRALPEGKPSHQVHVDVPTAPSGTAGEQLHVL